MLTHLQKIHIKVKCSIPFQRQCCTCINKLNRWAAEYYEQTSLQYVNQGSDVEYDYSCRSEGVVVAFCAGNSVTPLGSVPASRARYSSRWYTVSKRCSIATFGHRFCLHLDGTIRPRTKGSQLCLTRDIRTCWTGPDRWLQPLGPVWQMTLSIHACMPHHS